MTRFFAALTILIALLATIMKWESATNCALILLIGVQAAVWEDISDIKRWVCERRSNADRRDQ